MIYSYLFAALTHTALVFVCLRLLGGKGSIPFALVPLTAALVLTATWGWYGLALHRDPDPFSVGLHLLLDLLRYGCWFAFLLTLRLQRPAPRSWSVYDRAMVAGATVLVLLSLLPALALVFTHRLPASLLRWTPLTWMFLPIVGLVLLEQVHRNTAEGLRWAMKPFALALLGVFAFDLYLTSRAVLLSQVDGASIAMRGLVHGLSAPLLWVALRRHGDGLARFALSRQAAFHTAALLLIGGYLLLVAMAGYSVREFDAAWGQALQLSFLAAALMAGAVVALSGTVRSALRVAVSKTFFRYRYDYRAEWLRFTARLSERSGRPDIGETVVRGLAEMVESPAGVLWTLHADGERFVPTVHWNMPRSPDSEARQSPFVRFMAEREWIVDVDEYRRAPRHYGGLQLPHWLTTAPPRQWLVIPLLSGEDLTGFVVLAPPRAPMRIDWEVRDLLKTASRQAATFLAHVAATEALMESRRFEAFNQMSAFVVHDLKNVVTQLSLMMRNAQRLHADPEFQQDMLATVDSSLDKMRRLIRQLREGGAPAGAGGGANLEPMARRLLGMCAVQGRTLELRSSQPARVGGDEERLFRVLGHLVQNALDASTPADRVWLSIGLSAQHAVVVVGDTGQGMTAEFVRTRLFKPFHTTKAHGMGIGFYESVRYVQELGGSVEVDSEVGRGTCVTVSLPLHPLPAPSKPEEACAR